MDGEPDIPLPPELRASFWTRLHFAWSVVWIGICTVVCAIGYLVNHLFHRSPHVFSWWAAAWGRSMFLFTGIRVVVEGVDQIARDTPVVFLANHQNGLDIPVVAAVLPVSFGFVAKAELENVPFLGWVLSNSPSVFVDRADPRRSLESIQRAGAQIRDGSSVLIFPEGQRSYDGRLGPFMKGAFLLAVESGVPLVPVTIVDGVSVFNEQRRMSRPGVVRVVVGEPIPLRGVTRRDIPRLMDRSREAIGKHLPESWRNPSLEPG